MLLATQGANAPARPAGPRPTDPKRFQSVDMYAENTEGDIEYQRMVKDVSRLPFLLSSTTSSWWCVQQLRQQHVF